MNVIFPAYPTTHKIAPFWEQESLAAKAAGFDISVVSDQNDSGPLTLTKNEGQSSLYRGWIVKPRYYQELAQVIHQNNMKSLLGGHQWSLLTSPEDYQWSYDFPQWYAEMKDYTPASLLYTAEEVRTLGLEKIAEQLREKLGTRPLILKDWLKSRKDKWADACFIKDASDTVESHRIMTNFFFLQGREFYGGLVFRDFLSLKVLGTHKLGMPLPVEYRTFFLRQKPMMTFKYWQHDIDYPESVEAPPQAWLEEIGQKMKSPFVALDLALGSDGKWWVIEVNDGGTAGFSEHVDAQEFYRLLYQGLKG